ncbi:hypothetical protein ASD83_09965 [Devosia sp. Root685]|uniref:hypothetical protein n=1 Tax=Devosia sp. Root685 TaxID=1736587 RepID=UPI0006F8E8DC|nr:hypothetical protein [Devosia sp. Root685]KRA97451.1 hypothetical protein ASD83_09965 [Devosia sp. Root685]
MMQPLGMLAIVGALALAGCSSGEAPLIAGGPTPTQAIDAMLGNTRILESQSVVIVRDRVKLDATDCAKHPNSVVTCRVRLYSIGRGWSAPSMGRFTETGGQWSFDF